METFGYWKTMNKQMRFSLNSARSGLAVIAVLAWGFGAGTTPAQTGGDRIPVTLSDPSRPARVKGGMVNGGITAKAYEGKVVVDEDSVRGHEKSRNEGGPKLLAISTKGHSVEKRSN